MHIVKYCLRTLRASDVVAYCIAYEKFVRQGLKEQQIPTHALYVFVVLLVDHCKTDEFIK